MKKDHASLQRQPFLAPIWLTAVAAIGAVVVLGFIKGRMIIQYFMEVRTAPRWLKLFTDAWLTILWAGVLAIYLF